MDKGRLIVIEGLDGSGKATQTGLLCNRLGEEWGKNFRRVSFPDYNDPSSALVKLYLGGELGGLDDISPYGASLFYTVDRYASYLRHWGEDYRKGFLIVADRYATSNVAHQMSKLPRDQWDGYLAWLEETEYIRVGIPRPGLGYDQDFGCISFFIQTGGNHVSFRNVTGWNLFLNKFLLYFPGVPV